MRLEELTDYEDVKLQLKFASDEEMSIGTRAFFKTKMSVILAIVSAELHAALGDYWATLTKQSDQVIAIHSILVLWRAVKDPLFAELSPEEQNQLQWACLLHDIAKRGSPCILGRDHCHAFRSAATLIEVFEKLGILPLPG